MRLRERVRRWWNGGPWPWPDRSLTPAEAQVQAFLASRPPDRDLTGWIVDEEGVAATTGCGSNPSGFSLSRPGT